MGWELRGEGRRQAGGNKFMGRKLARCHSSTGLSLPWKPFWKKNYGDKRSGKVDRGEGKIVGRGKIRSKGADQIMRAIRRDSARTDGGLI